MQEITKYGVKFIKINKTHLEMVREWRNSDDVRLFMKYQKVITSDDQLRWFESIDNDKNYYFVAYIKDEPVGLYNIKNINFNLGYGECGSFLKNRNYWESKETISFNFLLIHFAFEILKLNYVVCTILKSNKKVIMLNLQLGYIQESNSCDDESLFFKLDYESFKDSKSYKLIKYLEKI
nr:GNAT family N-acetyltransferase [uncultured Flavobacterium sp.]